MLGGLESGKSGVRVSFSWFLGGSIPPIKVPKIGIVVGSSFQDVIWKFHIACEGLCAAYGARGAYGGDEVDSHKDDKI
jgi:hypothetical protein